MPLDSRFTVPVPASVREHLDANTHPGLLLDKYTASWSGVIAPEKLSGEVQRPTVDEVVRLSFETPPGLDWEGLQRRRQFLLDSMKQNGRIVVRATTASPLTLHLSRASSLENAGICLHRTFGFAYLPGTGVKGMTRAYAETVWLHAQSDKMAAWKRIEDVFGWAPNDLRKDQLEERGEFTSPPATKRVEENGVEQKDEVTEHSGAIVFHDAWPEKWPRLQADLLNNHHRAYYEGPTKKGHQVDENPPGDWEEPNMVSFLAVAPGVTFTFPIAKRRADVPPVLLDLAAEWVIGALTHSGAGAKTNAGYGDFTIEHSDEVTKPLAGDEQTWQSAKLQRRAEAKYTLELVTPAFLAGPHPDVPQLAARECDLRTATLRGMLRWWWRTMHAAWVDVPTLRRLETAIWGDTQQVGAVRVRIESVGAVAPVPFDRRKIVFDNKLPPPPTNIKATQGLTYCSYGMDESKGRRFMIVPGTKWRVTLTASPTKLPLSDQNAKRKSLSDPVRLDDASVLLNEAQHALWLLCEFGGVGSKSRKGFGNFANPPEFPKRTLEECQATAKLFRQACKLPVDPARPRDAESPSLEHLIVEDPVATPWSNYWFALDRLGDSAQQFAQAHKHNSEKLALGLPRRIKSPFGVFKTGQRAADSDRHSSPIMAHLKRDAGGNYAVQLIAFPSVELPADKTAEKSRQFLRKAIQQIKTNLEHQGELHSDEGQTAARTLSVTAPPPAVPAPTGSSIKPGDWVKAILLTEKTSKGGWKAQHPGTKLSGPIQNSGEVPGDYVVGNELELVVAVFNGREIAFRYPTKGDEERKNKPPKPPTQTPPRRR